MKEIFTTPSIVFRGQAIIYAQYPIVGIFFLQQNRSLWLLCLLMKSTLMFDLLNTLCWREITELFTVGISLAISSSVCMLKIPRRKLLFTFPLNLTPAIILFSILSPSMFLGDPNSSRKKRI